jgi:environmental stress-induced protein Ves
MTAKTNSSIGTHIEHAAQPPGTWAGGTSSAIYAHPPDTIGTMAQARVWVATAVIERDSPFSYFAERTRVHMPIHGNGINLHFQNPEETVRLETFHQHRFDGARPLQVTLNDGPIVAFNLIAQTDVGTDVQVLHVENPELMPPIMATTPPKGEAMVVRVIYAVIGTVALEVAGQPTTVLQPDDAFVIHPYALTQPPAAPVSFRPEAAITRVLLATMIFDAVSSGPVRSVMQPSPRS